MSHTTTIEPPAGTARLAGKYLTFVLNGESYGVSVLRVREIVRPSAITPLPQVPAYVKGVINLRGRIVPVIDLCARLALTGSGTTDGACIVVVSMDGADQRPTFFGLLVDAVEEVGEFAAADIEPAPDFCAGLGTSGILGLVKVGEAVKTLLNLDGILGSALALTAKALRAAS